MGGICQTPVLTGFVGRTWQDAHASTPDLQWHFRVVKLATMSSTSSNPKSSNGAVRGGAAPNRHMSHCSSVDVEDDQSLFRLFWELFQEYWTPQPPHIARNMCAKEAFHVRLVLSCAGRDVSICDLGGGWGLFSAGCGRLGMKSIMIDDFLDPGRMVDADRRHRIVTECPVEFIRRDLIEEGIEFADDSIDVFTSFDSMEHWHHSPKSLFHQVRRALRPGGWFVLGVPNNVDLLKRITVPLGRGDWSSMAWWYEKERFRSHVREPSVADLKYIARDLQLTDVRILGRNWGGYDSGNRLIRTLMPVLDHATRWRPTLCSTIYLLARKPAAAST